MIFSIIYYILLVLFMGILTIAVTAPLQLLILIRKIRYGTWSSSITTISLLLAAYAVISYGIPNGIIIGFAFIVISILIDMLIINKLAALLQHHIAPNDIKEKTWEELIDIALNNEVEKEQSNE